ncbi:hypothetical protein Goklo_023523 [Gossypium klotzschianum]|uniref:Uncharacterized protein n=1 Tax=Gossypium klotzschianum TaxID=34286 RepID=A0A7J8TQW5_9ROSI|nr:hypothetical protein [Gossypium klotzschianum]
MESQAPLRILVSFSILFIFVSFILG